MDSNASPSGLDPVERLAEEYLRRRRQGERPTAAEYAARYPDLAGRILDLFPAREWIEGLVPTPEDHASLSGKPDDLSTPAGTGGRAERLGDYTLLRELGRGGMGIVYEAEHESLKNRVALKVMHPRFRADRAYLRRFQTEARRRRSCTTPTSCRSSTTGNRMASATTRCNASTASGWSGC